jgi:2-oxo-4-hydroxy-4-carboxy-5-ureidoimidazoline decarboxylase
MNSTLERWNATTHEQAIEDILPCNGSRAWAAQVAALRPFATAFELTCTADIIWRSLPKHDWQQAFDSHPRIGEQKAKSATAESLKWSAGEQAAANPDESAKAALAEGNRAYEQKFGRIFIVCATGKSAAEMLAILNLRMSNDPATELREAAEQQRRITQLRLRKWLGMAI